jgi:hypothetical protein
MQMDYYKMASKWRTKAIEAMAIMLHFTKVLSCLNKIWKHTFGPTYFWKQVPYANIEKSLNMYNFKLTSPIMLSIQAWNINIQREISRGHSWLSFHWNSLILTPYIACSTPMFVTWSFHYYYYYDYAKHVLYLPLVLLFQWAWWVLKNYLFYPWYVEPYILSGSYSLLYNYTFVTLPFILHYLQCCLYSPCSLSPMGFSSSTLLGYRATGSIYYQSSFITLPPPVLPHNSMRIQST